MGAKRIAIYTACIVLAVLAVLVFVHHRARHAEEVQAEPNADVDVAVVSARLGNIAQTLTVAGVFQPFQEIDVHGKVSGYIRHIYVDIGDRVRRGQTLAVLEVPELSAQVEGAQAGVTASREQIQRLQSDVAREKADYAAVHANYLRLKQASDQQPGLIAAQELDDALARDRAADSQVDAARAAVLAGEGQLGVSRAEQLRVSSLERYAIITAPYSGVVTMRYADTGALIPAGTAEGVNQAVIRLAQSDVLRLRMPVPEQDVPLIDAGSRVTVHVQATGQQFPGTVVRYTRDVSDTTRTMLTEVDVDNPQLQLTPGMYADVTFRLRQKANALLIPVSSIIQGDQPSVMAVDAQRKIVRVPVSLGIGSANLQEVTGGLRPGEQVVVGGLETLQPGERVQPHPAPVSLVEYQPAPSPGEGAPGDQRVLRQNRHMQEETH